MNPTMRLVAVAAVLAGLTSAQGTLPSCATACVTQYTSGSQIGGCGNLDIVCICSNKDFISGIAWCLSSACDAADQEAATNYALSICKSAGVTGIPTAVSCTSTATSTASPAPSSSSATGAVATTASSASSASSGSQSISSSVSSVSSSLSSAAASVSSKASSQASSASSSASSAATSATKNASPQNVAGLGAGVLGGLAAAVALL